MKRQTQPAQSPPVQSQPIRHPDQHDPAEAEAQTAARRDDPDQNWDRQGMPEGPRYGRTQYDGGHLADPVRPQPDAEAGYPDDRGEFGNHTYGQAGRRTRTPYAAGRGGRRR